MRPYFAAYVLVAACSPFNGGEQFNCQQNSDCNVNAGGVCEPGNLCAYPAAICPDPGLAYGDNSGSLSGTCVPAPENMVDAGSDQTTTDAFVAPPDAPPTTDCVGNGNVMQLCVGLPQVDRDFNGVTLLSHGSNNTPSNCDFLVTVPDTTGVCKGSACTQAGPALCVIQGKNIHLQNVSLRDPTGTRPIVFVATDSITIDGTLDGTTKHNQTFPPGADTLECSSLSAQDKNGGAGGGAGGTNGTAGGNGGAGAANSGDGGKAQPAATSFSIVQSGCRAGSGGDSNSQGIPGRGGSGAYSGGVVYLIAKNNITINGTVDVSGEGGDPGQTASGGGGGGPGGFVALDGSTIKVPGSVVANGGAGGGAGGAGVTRRDHNVIFVLDFQDGKSGQSGGTTQAKGGDGGGSGGKGGNGTDGGNPAGATGASFGAASCGGGGGGGGQGLVWVVAHAGTTLDHPEHLIGVRVDKQ